MAYGDYQNEIYFKGLQGVKPTFPVDFATLEQRTVAALPPSMFSYVQGGCGDEFTQNHNAQAFRLGPDASHDGRLHDVLCSLLAEADHRRPQGRRTGSRGVNARRRAGPCFDDPA